MQAIVLAGQRDGEEALTQYTGASCKALIEIDGKPMLLRVLETLGSSASIKQLYLSGPDKLLLQQQPEINQLVLTGKVHWSVPGSSPSASAYDVLKKLPSDFDVMLTTADNPLLTKEMVEYFCTNSKQLRADVVIGLAPYELVTEAFPKMRKTLLKFSGGSLCGCNLFAFTSSAGREAAKFWRRFETERKKPMYIIRFLGLFVLLRYFLGRLALDQALALLSQKLGLKVACVTMPFSHAAVDVDSVDDYLQVDQLFHCNDSS